MQDKITPLLKAYFFVAEDFPLEELDTLQTKLHEDHIFVILCGNEDELTDINSKMPRVYVSIGSDWRNFPSLISMPAHEKKRWLHFESPDKIEPCKLFYCWLSATDPLPENKTVPLSSFTSDKPLVSVFTAAYRSSEKIQRPFKSLQAQTYDNWEWVIVDDSGDNEETYRDYLSKLDDPRIRRYRQDSYNGYIGSTKRYAAGLCTGEILVEVDHDDELTPDCLEKIVRAFQENPDCGFVYGDCTEVFAENLSAHWYGWDCGFGYSVYYRIWLHSMNRWQNILRHTTINGNTIRHLVGLPNHPRAWTRECYHLIGGHREELLVSDDYDLLVRTFLSTKYASVPDLLYIQYRNEGGSNSTFTRNRQIQILVRELKNYYHNRIYEKIRSLEMPELVPYSRIWETGTDDPARKTAHAIHEDTSKKSIIFPIPYSSDEKEHIQLYEILNKGLKNGFRDFEVIIIGNIPADINLFASKAPSGSIRWWPMEASDPIEFYVEYGKFCASCRDKIVIMPTH
ncbi:glycosyltransferase [Bacillus infantis]|uniref:glycosyltransferase n=1 Tax=Bacillus infantis TaxID=324767 RepID=UPI003CE84416